MNFDKHSFGLLRSRSKLHLAVDKSFRFDFVATTCLIL
jgi:hypothetical protein